MPDATPVSTWKNETNKASSEAYPLISIITVVYNGEKYLEQTIQSVLNQSYTNIEYIIIDGASTDNTLTIINKYEDKINYWISESDNGIFDAMNKGIAASTGKLVGIVNSDDWLEPDALQNIADNFLKFPEVDVFHGLLRFIKNNSEYMVRGSYSSFFHEGLIEHPTFFIKREIYQKFGGYSLEYKSAADLDFIYKLVRNDCKFLFLNKVISNFRLGGISDSFSGLRETFVIMKKHKYISKKKYLLELLKLSVKKILK